MIVKLDDADPNQRETAAEQLSAIGKNARPAIPVLIRHVQDPEFYPRLRSIEALGSIGPDASVAVPSLINVINDPTWQIGNMAVWSLADIGPGAKQAIPSLEAVIQRPKDSERYTTMMVGSRVALARITGNFDPQVQFLMTLLGSKNSDELYEAMNGLESLQPASKIAVPLICNVLANQQNDSNTRLDAARALANFKAAKAIPFLEQAGKNDPDFSVRFWAIDTLEKLGAPPAQLKQLRQGSALKQDADIVKQAAPINEKLKNITTDLPRVTSVEVYRLACYLADNPDPAAPKPPPHAALFPMNPDGYTLVITGKSVLSGTDAEQLAGEWRHLAFGIQYQALCHFPIYGLKFISGGRLLLMTTICWHCSDFSLGNEGYDGFDSRQESSLILKKHLETLLPPLKK